MSVVWGTDRSGHTALGDCEQIEMAMHLGQTGPSPDLSCRATLMLSDTERRGAPRDQQTQVPFPFVTPRGRPAPKENAHPWRGLQPAGPVESSRPRHAAATKIRSRFCGSAAAMSPRKRERSRRAGAFCGPSLTVGPWRLQVDGIKAKFLSLLYRHAGGPHLRNMKQREAGAGRPRRTH